MGFFDSVAGSVFGKVLDLGVSEHNADKNREMQERFAKQGIRWKVADAKAAGLHPLAALGASTTSFSPVAVGSDFGSMGQDIARAQEAQATQEERAASRSERQAEFRRGEILASKQLEEADARIRGLHLDNQAKELDNAMRASDIAKRRAQLGPSVPGAGIPGSAHTGAIQFKPSEITSREPGDSARAGGIEPAWRRYEVMPGYYLDLPGQQMSESLEGSGEVAAGLIGLPATVMRNLSNWKQNLRGYPPELGPPRDGMYWRHKGNGVWEEVPASMPWR